MVFGEDLVDFLSLRKIQGLRKFVEVCARFIEVCARFIEISSSDLSEMTSKDALSIGTDVKPPVLFKGKYGQWKDIFLDFIDRHANGENIMLSITEGPMVPITVQIPDDDSSDSEDGTEEREQKTKPVKVDLSQYFEEQKSRYKADKQARSLLLQRIPNEIYIKIDSYKDDAKKMWDQLQKMMMGSKIGN
ncbi:hypothetical protein L6452_37000 [Arctium lappa]|uniref:Uncharacterized protein n=1 Tax=Arctium lappa TaxID=4217 RepID=A0ACB8Y132_ARCLA|nr:hypothetical protein L6452_37000 [Arctium lappa]